MQCPFCQASNLDGNDFCTDCGYDLHRDDMPEARSDIEMSVMFDPVIALIPASTITVAPDTPTMDVMRRIAEDGCNCALVSDDGTVRGIFTERDVLMRISGRDAAALNLPVREFMTPNPECVAPKDTIAYALNKMMIGGYRHVPVEEDGNAIGVVSVRHVIQYLFRKYPDLSVDSATK